MDYKADPPDDVWVDYALPWIEGRCIPEKRLKLDGERWVMQYRYPKPDTDEKALLTGVDDMADGCDGKRADGAEAGRRGAGDEAVNNMTL